MDSGIPVREISSLRSESDLYGYSDWLAKHMKRRNDQPRANMQHMWIWWDLEPRDVYWALDPNCFNALMLVQDDHIKSVIEQFNHPVVACGIQYMNFHENHPIQVEKNGKTLYVSTHSTAWRDVSKHTKQAVKEFTKDNDVTVLLSKKDSHLGSELGVPWLQGADVLDAGSFYRIQKIFSEFTYMVTDRMGSHVLYGLACGMKVGLHAKYNIDTVFSETAKELGMEERARSTRDIQFLADRFPGLVIESGLPTYTTMPKIASETPERIAQYLWS